MCSPRWVPSRWGDAAALAAAHAVSSPLNAGLCVGWNRAEEGHASHGPADTLASSTSRGCERDELRRRRRRQSLAPVLGARRARVEAAEQCPQRCAGVVAAYISVTRDNNQYDMATLFAPWIIMVAVVSTSTYVDSAAVTCAAAFAAGSVCPCKLTEN